MFAFLYHAAPATRSRETGKNRIGPPPQPSLPAICAAIVADDVRSGPGTRQSSTRAIYKTGASVWPRCSVTEYRGHTRRIR